MLHQRRNSAFKFQHFENKSIQIYILEKQGITFTTYKQVKLLSKKEKEITSQTY